MVVPPWVNLDDLRTLSGVTLPEKFFHSSNMRTFPKYVNNGENEISYGYSLECANLTVFGRLLDRV